MRNKTWKNGKKFAALAASLMLATAVLGGCGASTDTVVTQTQEATVEATTEVQEQTTTETQVQTEEAATEEVQSDVETTADTEKTAIRIGALKGPTTLGLLSLQEKTQNGEASQDYTFEMMTAADEILPLMIKGELDIALIPANVAGVLYQKTNGGIQVIDINTLGVLYMVSGDTEISEPADLEGKTIYLTGKGTTPDYVLHYILEGNGIAEGSYTLEYRSEATEVAAILAEDSSAVGLLPQPFVTAACAQNEALSVVMDMTAEWSKLQGEAGSQLVTGVTVVRTAFLQEHEEAVQAFMAEHKESAEAILADVEHGAALAVEAGIIAKEPLAQKAIPQCNITYIDGEEMKQALSGYLEILFEQNPESVGSALPEDDFYYHEG